MNWEAFNSLVFQDLRIYLSLFKGNILCLEVCSCGSLQNRSPQARASKEASILFLVKSAAIEAH